MKRVLNMVQPLVDHSGPGAHHMRRGARSDTPSRPRRAAATAVFDDLRCRPRRFTYNFRSSVLIKLFLASTCGLGG